ncbi:LOW QUALITY PROTEIN: Reverse transcriptase [Phytophthora palmivora]|uniref:Reverse transcriptase n=1 Tax=Phytophthora palmivora TaxID=4796 RepID=A0A2P4XZS5_9STRA|nr:LOW QUALITY PROTEIN: Reverse transcriptase [Phytophthora palmivora]
MVDSGFRAGHGFRRLSKVFLKRNAYIFPDSRPNVVKSQPISSQINEWSREAASGAKIQTHSFTIEDFPVIAAVPYELTDEQIRAGRNLDQAKDAFGILKHKIVSTSLLWHPDRNRPFVIIPHANAWAACAVLGQEYDGVIHPVRYTSRFLNESEIRYHIAVKEVIAILRVLQVFRTLIEQSQLVVYTRYSVLKWGINSKSADGRCVPWGLTLPHWDLDIRKVQKDEDGLAAIMGAGTTPREHLNEISESLIPMKGRIRKPPVMSIEMLESDYEGVVLSFDGAAKTSTRKGSCGCVLWKLPGWKIMEARGFALDDVTVNDAEYHGLLKGMIMASGKNIEELVVVGDSSIAIQQVQGLVNCNQPHLQKHLAQAEVLKHGFRKIMFVHLKRDCNQAADYLTTKTLALDESWTVTDEGDLRHLKLVSKIPEKLMKSGIPDADCPGIQIPKVNDSDDHVTPGPESAPLPEAARVMAVITEAGHPDSGNPDIPPMGPLELQAERWRRIKVHQDADEYLSELKAFLKGNLEKFSRRRLRKIAKLADLFILGSRDIQFRMTTVTQKRPRDFLGDLRLVVPESLRSDMLHYAHGDFQGRHQSIRRTHEKLLAEYYWPGMYADVERHAKACVDCASGKGRPPNPGPSPGNIEPSYPGVDGLCDASSKIRWDAQNTILAMLGPKPASVPERSAYEWRRKMQRDYSYAMAFAEDLQKKAKRHRSEIQTQKWRELSDRLKSGFTEGDSVWLYIPKVQTGLSRKLAQLWHGPFRIDEIHEDFRVKLKVEARDTVSTLGRQKPRALFPKRPIVEIDVEDDDDFDVALLPEDSWTPDAGNGEYEVKKILDPRWSKRSREYLVKWKGYDEPEWLPVSQLSCGALLYEFNQGARARARFQAMQAGNNHPRV